MLVLISAHYEALLGLLAGLMLGIGIPRRAWLRVGKALGLRLAWLPILLREITAAGDLGPGAATWYGGFLLLGSATATTTLLAMWIADRVHQPSMIAVSACVGAVVYILLGIASVESARTHGYSYFRQ